MATSGWAFLADVSPEGWTAIGTWVLAVVTMFLAIGTLFAVWWQVREQRASNMALLGEQHETSGVTVLLRLVETWDGETMRRNRDRLKYHLERENPVAAIKARKLMGSVAGFFELVGALTRRNVLDHDMVWGMFSYYAVHYFAALQGLILEERELDSDPTLYEDFEWLSDEMKKIDRRRRGPEHDPTPTRQQVRDFVANEPNN